MKRSNIICTGIDLPTITALRKHFAADVFEFLSFSSAQELINNVKKCKPRLIFLNRVLSDFDNCQEICIALRALPVTETVPTIILTTGTPDQKEKINLFQAGLIDGYFAIPMDIEELAAYSKVFLQRQALQQELEEKNKLLSKISITDELTQLYNRRYLAHRLNDELKRIKRYNYSIAGLMLDLDHFKKINDTYGHAEGDRLLKAWGQILKDNLRAMDIICRYGGEEIIVLLPHTDIEGAYLAAQRLRKTIKRHDFGSGGSSIKITVSIGVAAFTGNDDITIDLFVQALDKQLYQAKNGGRDKACRIS